LIRLVAERTLFDFGFCFDCLHLQRSFVSPFSSPRVMAQHLARGDPRAHIQLRFGL
jgi:hypothetical protein